MATTDNLPFTRFKQDATPAECIAWVKTHRYVWYHAPMDTGPRRLGFTSKVMTWQRQPDRFAVTVQYYDSGENIRFRIDNEHLDRLRIPNALWWHGITATVHHQHKLSNGFVSLASRGSIKQRGIRIDCGNLPVEILSTKVTVHQSNGYWLPFDKLAYAIEFCKQKNIRLTAGRGRRIKVLVSEKPEPGERNWQTI